MNNVIIDNVIMNNVIIDNVIIDNVIINNVNVIIWIFSRKTGSWNYYRPFQDSSYFRPNTVYTYVGPPWKSFKAEVLVVQASQIGSMGPLHRNTIR